MRITWSRKESRCSCEKTRDTDCSSFRYKIFFTDYFLSESNKRASYASTIMKKTSGITHCRRPTVCSCLYNDLALIPKISRFKSTVKSGNEKGRFAQTNTQTYFYGVLVQWIGKVNMNMEFNCGWAFITCRKVFPAVGVVYVIKNWNGLRKCDTKELDV